MYGWVRMFTELYGAAGLWPGTICLWVRPVCQTGGKRSDAAARRLPGFYRVALATGGDPPTHKAPADKAK